MRSLILRIIRQFANDKRSLALMLIVPVLIMSLLYLLLGESSYTPAIAVAGDFPDTVLSALKDQDAKISTLPDNADTDRFLEDKEADAVLTMDENGLHVRMLETSSVKTAGVTDVIKSAMQEINPRGSMDITYIYGRTDATAFDSLGYMLLGVLSFFFVFIISGISFVRERTTGTMERLMLTPVKRSGVVAGYTVGFGIFSALQSVILVLFTKYVLNMEFEGSVLLAILIMVLLAFIAVSMGAFVSIYANSEFQVMQFIPVIVIPQIFFSGLISIDTLPFGLGNLSYIMPVYYGCTGLENVLIRGYGLDKILFYLLILLLFIVVLFFLNTLALKKYRRL